jgi:hypothetical protein
MKDLSKMNTEIDFLYAGRLLVMRDVHFVWAGLIFGCSAAAGSLR